MVGIARGPVVTVKENEVAGGINAIAITAEEEGLLEGNAAATAIPERLRDLEDAPLVGHVHGQFGLESRVGPEGLPEAEYIGVHAGALAVMEPAPVAGDVGGLVEEAHRGGVERRVIVGAGGENFLAAEQDVEDTVFEWDAVAGEYEVGEDWRNASAVPEEVVALTVHPGVVVEGGKMQRSRPHALIPDGIGVVLLEVAPEAVEGNGGPLSVAGTYTGGDAIEPVGAGIVAAASLGMFKLQGEGVGNAQAFVVSEYGTFLNQVPEEDHHVGVVVVWAGQRRVLVLEPLPVNLRYFLARLGIREGEADGLAGMVLVAGHVVHRHVLADAVPAEVADRAVAL